MKDTRKIFGTLLGILGFIAVMAGLSYAMYVLFLSNNNVIAGRHDCMNIVYNKGTDISASDLEFVASYSQSSANTSIVFNESGQCQTKSIGTISFYTDSSTSSTLLSGITTNGVSHGVLKYTIVNAADSTDIYEGYITNTGDTDVDIGILNSSSTTYNVYLWLEEDPNENVTLDTISEAVYSGYIHASARQSTSFR